MTFMHSILDFLSQGRQARGWALFAALGCAAGLVMPAGAQAQVLATCTIVEKAVFNPPLTNQPQNVTVTLTALGACPTGEVDTTAAGVEVSQESVIVPGLSCISLATKPNPQVEVYRWSDGNASTYSGTSEPELVGNLLTVVSTGNIVAGKFAGHNTTFTRTFPATDIATCEAGFGTTVKSVYGYGTLIVL